MQLIIKNDKIHLRYQSSSKIVTKSLRLKATKQNLKYAQTTLLPIFARLYAVSNTPPSPISAKRTKSAKKSNFATNFTQISSSNLPCISNLMSNSKPNHMPNFAPNSAQILASNPFANLCQKSLAKIALNCKLSTLQTARYVYRSLLNFISTRHISSPRHSDFEAYFCHLRTKNLSIATARLHLSYINSALKFATTKRANISVCVPNSTISPHRQSNFTKQTQIHLHATNFTISRHKTPFSLSQIARLIRTATGELQTFLAIAFLTGARAGEILALHKSDIDFHNATIIIDKNQTRYELTTPKNGRPRTIHAPRELIAHLKNANLSDGKIFTSDYFQIYYAFQKLLKCLKFAPCGLHITRHSYATLLMQNTISPLFIAQNLGHSDANLVNRIYSHYIFDKVQITKLEKVMKFGKISKKNSHH